MGGGPRRAGPTPLPPRRNVRRNSSHSLPVLKGRFAHCLSRTSGGPGAPPPRAGPAPSRRPRPAAAVGPGEREGPGAAARPPSLRARGAGRARGARVLGPRLPAAGAHRLTGVLRFRFFASAETEQSAPRRWGRPPSGPALVGLRGCRRGSA